jgi:hypothetical protein
MKSYLLLIELSIDLNYSLCSDKYFTVQVNVVMMLALFPGSLWTATHRQEDLSHISSEGLKQLRFPWPSSVTLLSLYHSSALQHRQE